MYSNESRVNSNVCQSCGSVTYNETVSYKKSGIVYMVFGWLFAAISLIFLPIVFGAAAFFMGFLTYYGRSKVHGAIIMVFASVGLVLGSLFSFFVAGTMFI
jgi:uncharacterized membrane protein